MGTRMLTFLLINVRTLGLQQRWQRLPYFSRLIHNRARLMVVRVWMVHIIMPYQLRLATYG